VETLSSFFGTDRHPFTIDSAFAGVTTPVRTYSRFSQALEEVLDARIFGGMHYRNSTQKGAILGKQVSQFATRHFFRRQDEDCREHDGEHDRDGDRSHEGERGHDGDDTRCPVHEHDH
jgi:hypothetical protein